MFNTGFFFGLNFDSEDGGDMSSETMVYFHWSTRRNITEDINFHSHTCENLKSEYLSGLTVGGHPVSTLPLSKLL